MPVSATAIREQRQKRGLTQQTLADRAGISVQYVNDLEAGRRTLVRNKTIVRSLARALRTSIKSIEV